MAVKLAHAMGAEVTVLSQSLKKQEDGLRWAPTTTTRPATRRRSRARRHVRPHRQHGQRASSTSDAYLGLLAVDGAMVNVGAPAEPLSVHVFSLLGGAARSPAR
jgi:uncharacterized zinc-type alcohol dehydrogenase-like protein